MKTNFKHLISASVFAVLIICGCSKNETPVPPKKQYNCMDLLIARTTIDLPGQYNRFKLQLDELLVQEPLIDTIYLVPDSGWYIATTEVSLLKETLDEFIDKDKNRIRGKGTLVFDPGALQGPEDAEWFNIRGWNVKIR